MNTLKIYGDSIIKGVIYSPTGRKYSLCKEHRVDKLKCDGWQIVNLAKMGATSRDGLRILENDTTPTDAQTTVLIEFGGNDCAHDWPQVAARPNEDHYPAVSPKEFCRNLHTLIQQIRSHTSKISLVIPPPIHTQRYFDFICTAADREKILSWLKTPLALYQTQELYSILVRQVAQEANCPVLDLRTLFLGARDVEVYFCLDGCHPNEKGHGMIVEAIKKHVGI